MSPTDTRRGSYKSTKEKKNVSAAEKVTICHRRKRGGARRAQGRGSVRKSFFQGVLDNGHVRKGSERGRQGEWSKSTLCAFRQGIKQSGKSKGESKVDKSFAGGVSFKGSGVEA